MPSVPTLSAEQSHLFFKLHRIAHEHYSSYRYSAPCQSFRQSAGTCLVSFLFSLSSTPINLHTIVFPVAFYQFNHPVSTSRTPSHNAHTQNPLSPSLTSYVLKSFTSTFSIAYCNYLCAWCFHRPYHFRSETAYVLSWPVPCFRHMK